MTTTIPSPTTVLPDRRLVRHYRQSFGRVLRFEWIKFRTLRASWVGQALLVALLIGFSALAAAMSNNRMGETGPASRFAEMGPVATVLTAPTSACWWSVCSAASSAPASTAHA